MKYKRPSGIILHNHTLRLTELLTPYRLNISELTCALDLCSLYENLTRSNNDFAEFRFVCELFMASEWIN